jgi:ABC-type transport system involved in multi-copper enzyme maturation permease subunit
VNRVVFITAMVLLIASHLLVAILAWRRVEPNMDLAEWFAGSSFYSLVLLQLAFALLGGNSIAGERVDRSAEFLSYLPVSRGRILASKLLVSLAAVPLIWLPNLAVLATAYAARSGNVRPHFVSDFLGVFAIIGITGLTFFCVAWLLSCVLLSPTYSVSAGLITPLLVATGVCWVEYLLGLERGGNFVVWCYGGLCLVISAASFLSGTIYYLRRAEP